MRRPSKEDQRLAVISEAREAYFDAERSAGYRYDAAMELAAEQYRDRVADVLTQPDRRKRKSR